MIRTLAAGLALGLAVAAPAMADDAPKAKAEPSPILVDLTLKGSISEDPAPVGLDGAPMTDNLKGLIDRIAKAKADPQVKGLVVRVRDLSVGLAKAHELRKAIKDFRASGKKAYAVLEMAGNREYLVATAADEIVMPESGWLMIKGLSAEVTFYKKALEKLGIHADALQVGEFKGAGEPFSRTEMSPAFREELTSVLTDNFDQMVEAIASRQGIPADEARKLIEAGPYTPSGAKAAGLVNRLAYPDQIETEIAKGLGLTSIKLETKYGKKAVDPSEFQGFAGFMKMMQALSGETAKKPASARPKVAVIYAAGMIQTGRSSSGSLMGDAVMGSDTVVKHLRQAEKDKTVKAIVLRVDSPGGSALASDLMWREIVRIGQAKPIVASMSDVAASGGYYISMGCSRIFAEPGTLTGSIGVVSVKLALGGLMDKVGITTDRITIGKNGGFLSPYRPMTEDERAAMRRMMDDTYKQFVSKAAQGRKMDVSRVEKLAGGRVYTGRQARKNGLVDELGTLDDAIAEAKKLAKLEGDSDLLVLPQAPSFFEALLAPFEDRDVLSPEALLPAALKAPLARLNRLARLLKAEPVTAIMPFELEIR